MVWGEREMIVKCIHPNLIFVGALLGAMSCAEGSHDPTHVPAGAALSSSEARAHAERNIAQVDRALSILERHRADPGLAHARLSEYLKKGRTGVGPTAARLRAARQAFSDGDRNVFDADIRQLLANHRIRERASALAPLIRSHPELLGLLSEL